MKSGNAIAAQLSDANMQVEYADGTSSHPVFYAELLKKERTLSLCHFFFILLRVCFNVNVER